MTEQRGERVREGERGDNDGEGAEKIRGMGEVKRDQREGKKEITWTIKSSRTK